MGLSKCAVSCMFVVAFVVVQANADVENLVIENASFEDDYTGWWQGMTAPAAGGHEIETGDVMDGAKAARIVITAVSGTNWHVGMANTGLVLEQDTLYTVDFFAKADVNRVITVEIKVASPYEWIGEADVDITEEWTDYSHSFTPTRDFAGEAQVAFWFGQVTGAVWLDGVRVYEGAKQDRPTTSVEAEGKLITSWAAIKASY